MFKENALQRLVSLSNSRLCLEARVGSGVAPIPVVIEINRVVRILNVMILLWVDIGVWMRVDVHQSSQRMNSEGSDFK